MRLLVKNSTSPSSRLQSRSGDMTNYADSVPQFSTSDPKNRKSNLEKGHRCLPALYEYSSAEEGFARDYPVSLYKNLNTRVTQWLLKSDPIAILRLLIFNKGYRSLAECIGLKGADVLLAFPQIGPTTGIQKSFCARDILRTSLVWDLYSPSTGVLPRWHVCATLLTSPLCVALTWTDVISRVCIRSVYVKLMYYTRDAVTPHKASAIPLTTMK